MIAGIAFGALSAAPLVASASSRAGQTAESQDPEPQDDWTLSRLTDPDMVAASLEFDNGLTFVTRCQNGVFDLILAGLPPAPANEVSRSLVVLGKDSTDETPTVWTVGKNRETAFSRIPAMFARILATGGPLQVIVPAAPGQARTRYIMTLPPSGAAVEESLTHCGRALVDPRDNLLEGDGDGLPGGITWVRPPRPSFPGSVGDMVVERGFVTTSCVVGPEGRLVECVLESEQPANFNLGRSVLRALASSRVGPAPDPQPSGRRIEGRMILFTTTFHLD